MMQNVKAGNGWAVRYQVPIFCVLCEGWTLSIAIPMCVSVRFTLVCLALLFLITRRGGGLRCEHYGRVVVAAAASRAVTAPEVGQVYPVPSDALGCTRLSTSCLGGAGCKIRSVTDV